MVHRKMTLIQLPILLIISFAVAVYSKPTNDPRSSHETNPGESQNGAVPPITPEVSTNVLVMIQVPLSHYRNLVAENAAQKKDLDLREKEIREMKPVLTIRKKIEIFEGLLGPELKDPNSVFQHAKYGTTVRLMDFHEAKWTIILTKTNDQRVVRLNKLMEKAGISKAIFCRTMGGFFLIASGGIHLPALNSYTPEEMETILKNQFQISDATTIDCVTRVLMVA